jgi:hypothetical protein
MSPPLLMDKQWFGPHVGQFYNVFFIFF